MNKPSLVKAYSSDDEAAAYRELERLFRSSPVDAPLAHLGLFLTRASLARILVMHDLYLKILDVPGALIELGCHWGQNLALFSALRTIYEPQNIGRMIVGFDTFDGHQAADERDGALMHAAAARRIGAMPSGYERVLDDILACHNALGPRAHLKKHEIVKGDAMTTFPAFLERHPEMPVALIYFDIGLYEPTKRCLEAVRDRLVKGSVIGLDHLGLADLPGDSIAVQEVLGYRNCRFVRDPRVPYQSYLVIE
jgi:hypothetical protein